MNNFRRIYQQQARWKSISRVKAPTVTFKSAKFSDGSNMVGDSGTLPLNMGDAKIAFDVTFTEIVANGTDGGKYTWTGTATASFEIEAGSSSKLYVSGDSVTSGESGYYSGTTTEYITIDNPAGHGTITLTVNVFPIKINHTIHENTGTSTSARLLSFRIMVGDVYAGSSTTYYNALSYHVPYSTDGTYTYSITSLT